MSLNISEKPFNPQLFTSTAVHAKFLPDAGRQDFSDDSVDDDDETGSTSLGVAHDLIGCVLAGEDNTGSCNHSGVDHVDMARQCLERYAKEESARAKRRASVGQNVVGIRFA
jgi:hypothetical protein